MNELRELYQEMILDHGRNPRNRGHRPEGANCCANGHNPLCGDRLVLSVHRDGEVVVDVGFEGQGCAISTAAASTMTETVKGRTVAEIEQLFDDYHAMVTEGSSEAAARLPGKLAVFAGVGEFPMRVKCATLAWHTLRAALAGDDRVSTE
jgi:nitrogen fixation NifU-like protein